MAEQLDTMLDMLKDAVAPIVAQIEQSTPTTQNHYVDYMSAIDRIARMIGKEPTTQVYLGVAIAMKRAGANADGVHSALHILGKI